MESVGNKMLLVLSELLIMKDKRRMMDHFVSQCNDLIPGFSFRWSNDEVIGLPGLFLKGRYFSYGTLMFDERLLEYPDHLAVLKNAIPLVALVLDHFESDDYASDSELFTINQSLVESEPLFRSFVENANDIVFSLASDGRFTYVSPKWTEILGHEVHEVVGENFADFVHSDDIPRCREVLKNAIATGEKQSGLEYRIKHKDGSWRWHVSNTSTVCDKDGSVVLLMGIAHDISDRKKMEMALKESEERLRVALEFSHTAVWDWDLAHDLWYASPLYYTMLGYPPEEGYADRKVWLDRVHPDDREMVSQKIRSVLSGEEKTYQYETRILHADGSYHWLSVQGHVALQNSAGKALRLLGTRIDISERKQAEESLRRLNRELRAISNCNQQLIHAEHEKVLLDEVCNIICKEAGYRFVWVGYAENDEEKIVRPMAWAGYEDGYLEKAGISWSETSKYGLGPTGRAIREKRFYCIQDLSVNSAFSPWYGNALQRGYRSSIALPLVTKDGLVLGALNIYSSETNSFTDDEIRLLEELAGDLAFGISSLRLRKEHQSVEESLSESEEKYRNLVESSMDAIYIYQDNAITYLNPAALKLFGAETPEQIIGKTPFDIVHSDYHQAVKERITILVKEEMPVSALEEKVVQLNGNLVDVEVTASPFPFKGKQAIQVIMRDISERKRIQNSLVESQALYHSFVEHLPASVFRKDAEGRYVFVNSLFCQLKGLTTDEIIGRTPAELAEYEQSIENQRVPGMMGVQRTLDDQGSQHHQQIMETGEAIQLIEEYLQKDGSIRYYQVIKSPVFDSNGKTIGTQGVQFDVTESREAEKKIRESEQLFSDIFYKSPVSVCITSREDSLIVDANDVFLHDLGFERQEVIGKSIADLGIYADPAYRDKLISSLTDTGYVSMFECPFRTKSGKIMYGIMSMASVLYKGKAHQLTTVVDITARKIAEEKIEYNRELLNEMGQVAKIGGWEFDCVTGKGTWTEEVAKIQEVDPAQETSLQLINSFYNSESNALIERAISEAVQFGKPCRLELELVTAKGNHKWVQIIGRPIFENGKTVKIRGSFQDVTEQKKINKELIAAKEKAEESDRLKSAFLANMSHEIRTPMNSIQGFSSLLPEEENHNLIVKYSHIIAHNSEQLMHIIDDIVLYSQLQTKLFSYHPVRFSTRKLFTDILQSFYLESTKGIELKLAPDSEELDIYTDYEKLRQIIANLVSNAFKYTFQGMIAVGVRKDDHHVLFWVRDTGIGIPANEVEKVFERFFRGSNVDKGIIGGTGLGLSIVKELIDILGGEIWIESSTGINGTEKGSTFFLSIPENFGE